MLGPVVLALSLVGGRLRDATDVSAPNLSAGDRPAPGRTKLHHLVPWFIIGFLTLAALRSLDLVPHPALAPVATAANLLTVVSMAALGLGVDVRVVAKAGPRVTAAVTASLLVLGVISLVLIFAVGVA